MKKENPALQSIDQLRRSLHGLVFFRSLRYDTLISLLCCVFDKKDADAFARMDAYADFACALYRQGGNLSTYLWNCIIEDENAYAKQRALGLCDPVLQGYVQVELTALSQIASLSGEALQEYLQLSGLPVWKTAPASFAIDYERRMEDISRLGYGQFARHSMFHIEQGEVKPVRSPDPVRLHELKGYARERAEVEQNTLALLQGKPAANALLYGDAGTGKSSTVKALVNEYAHRGLRLIEVKKTQLHEIPTILEYLRGNPLKFLLFLDDISFSNNSEEAGVLKAMLEGSASVKAGNIAIYATSNRRHIVNEKFSDRKGEDIHINETIQEQVSLSDRFGLSVYFGKPDRDAYITIAQALLADNGMELDAETLCLLAERFALERGGRSPRTAKQFVQMLLRERGMLEDPVPAQRFR